MRVGVPAGAAAGVVKRLRHRDVEQPVAPLASMTVGVKTACSSKAPRGPIREAGETGEWICAREIGHRVAPTDGSLWTVSPSDNRRWLHRSSEPAKTTSKIGTRLIRSQDRVINVRFLADAATDIASCQHYINTGYCRRQAASSVSRPAHLPDRLPGSRLSGRRCVGLGRVALRHVGRAGVVDQPLRQRTREHQLAVGDRDQAVAEAVEPELLSARP